MSAPPKTPKTPTGNKRLTFISNYATVTTFLENAKNLNIIKHIGRVEALQNKIQSNKVKPDDTDVRDWHTLLSCIEASGYVKKDADMSKFLGNSFDKNLQRWNIQALDHKGISKLKKKLAKTPTDPSQKSKSTVESRVEHLRKLFKDVYVPKAQKKTYKKSSDVIESPIHNVDSIFLKSLQTKAQNQTSSSLLGDADTKQTNNEPTIETHKQLSEQHHADINDTTVDALASNPTAFVSNTAEQYDFDLSELIDRIEDTNKQLQTCDKHIKIMNEKRQILVEQKEELDTQLQTMMREPSESIDSDNESSEIEVISTVTTPVGKRGTKRSCTSMNENDIDDIDDVDILIRSSKNYNDTQEIINDIKRRKVTKDEQNIVTNMQKLAKHHKGVEQVTMMGIEATEKLQNHFKNETDKIEKEFNNKMENKVIELKQSITKDITDKFGSNFQQINDTLKQLNQNMIQFQFPLQNMMYNPFGTIANPQTIPIPPPIPSQTAANVNISK